MQFHQLDGYIQNIYLVEYDHGLMLLDGCCRADVALLKSYITENLGRPFSDLKLVVVTHMHPDHAGAAHRLRELTGCRIASADKDQPWYRGFSGALMHWTDMLLAGWVAGRLGKPRRNLWYSPVLKPDIRLRDGATLPGFEQWQALETPGHTDRDLSLLHVPSGRVYVADLVVRVKGHYIAPFPVFHPNKYRASIQRIIDMAPPSIWLAHGGEVSLSDNEYAHLQASAPAKPKTHWRSTKGKIKRILLTRRKATR
ncbi:MBL fold metallo-hydrolase [Aestuariibacter halophilus]|uniref:MBL fold metallo-hydrolase n=1 Tax=Fluctibacter halophilus TaxID=226011 RepID=A0ABS8GBZ6_9ALTE|nr:MBL fold metallo-hydrolase [Aestuariibacter halophilus]MCC2618100.1 MBL fold metallo-hydrolase [Aestuariibacter halophilus]